ncbi:Peptidyl-dipeptidase (Dipeptidyl carboxypeptidase) [Propionibacterium freudenreichii]|uniref:M3 family metallopeptidase n=1 Tax=Propionibacterium freudenreichii TaxID=1744 RepID=UPI00054414BF|nr:M3 family metallopeptidase [Propionibacterium freudenreichii]CEH01612.1 Peptidyl-dipeptidase (Dipeptidyl carboxypeptidase) [Propionibacterium freudenreichii]CEH02956.1 Peptidyl-dipeptidase (Dipeptidyl carboxypeptidase) [Propionibacterium freudenreichii]
MSSSLPLQSEFELADFAALAPGDYEQIVHDAMAAELSGLRLVSDNPEPATVANTIEAWERAELALSRATAAFFTLHDADTSPELDAVAERLSSELAAHHDAIMLDAGLYDRVRDLSQAVEAGAEPGDEQVTWWLHERLRDFRRSGVALSPEDQERLRVLNARIARLESQFGQRVVAGRNEAAVHITDPAELAGLSEEQRTEAERAAGARDLDGWLLELVNTTGQDWLASLSHQEVRRRVFEASMSRGVTGGNETGSLVVQLARVRADRAALLGYASHAAYVADGGCAKTVDAIRGLLDPFSKLSVHQASEDSLRFREIFTDLAVGKEFGPWDWSWVASRERARAELDDEALRPYLEFEQVLTRGVFEAAHRLYGITVERREGLTGYTPDVRVYEVHEQDGTVLGLLLLDPWARPSKQGGAWMTDLVNANSLTGAKPVVTLNTNITRPRAGQPALLSWDQVITCFHEFGHCLHGLFADSRYPSLAGTNTPIDYVEFPSQVNERWARDPELLAHYARHWRTGEPLPSDLVGALVNTDQGNVGFDDLELVAAMQLDQAWHSSSPEQLPTQPGQVDAFENEALEERRVAFVLVPPRYRTRYFSHIWTTGYDGAYYAYLWAEVFDADASAWFDEHGGLDRAAGERFRREVLAPGGSVDVMADYRTFRGADPDVKYLLARHTRG